MFLNEYLDKSWNFYKLAHVCRKQGLPNLAINYLSELTQQLSYTHDSEGIRYERFKFDYEYIKLQMEFNTNSESLNKFMLDYCKLVDDRYLGPYKALKEYQNKESSIFHA